MSPRGGLPAALVDIDGTLVDSNYQHALARFWALRAPRCREAALGEIHGHIGMGGDHMVTALAGDDVEREAGDAIRGDEGRFYAEMIDEVEPLPHAREALVALAAGRAVVLTTSAKPDEADHSLDLLGVRDVITACVTGGDVDATKPEPDLVEAGLRRAGGGPAVMIGDSPWDCRAASRAGVPCVAVLTGGFSEQELLASGAVAVHRSIAELVEAIDDPPLGAEAE